MKLIDTTHLDSIPAGRISERDFVVFGGTFDPIHQGHVTVITRLLKRFGEVVVAPTPQNPWKDKQPTPIEDRIEIIKAVLAYEQISVESRFDPIRPPPRPSVYIEQYPYIYSIELVRHLRGMSNRNFWWAVGSDSEDDVVKWREWTEHGAPVAVVPVEIDVHSERIRSGKQPLHPAAAEIAKLHGWYKKDY